MSRTSNNTHFLVSAEYLINKLKIRTVFYASIISIISIFLLTFNYQFSVNLTFDGKLSQLPVNPLTDSSTKVSNTLIEVELNLELSELMAGSQNIVIELSESDIPVYRCKGEIISSTVNQNEVQNKTHIVSLAKSSNNGEIQFFPSKQFQRYDASVKLKNTRISFFELLDLIILEDLCQIEINNFS